MRNRIGSYEHAYSLIFGGRGLGDGAGAARSIDFRGESVEAALVVARLYGEGRKAELFEDGCPLGFVRLDPAGFWVITPSAARVVASRIGHRYSAFAAKQARTTAVDRWEASDGRAHAAR